MLRRPWIGFPISIASATSITFLISSQLSHPAGTGTILAQIVQVVAAAMLFPGGILALPLLLFLPGGIHDANSLNVVLLGNWIFYFFLTRWLQNKMLNQAH